VPAQELVVTHAVGKARAVEGLSVLGVDTTVSIDGLTLGKPGDAADAARMLRLLAGRTHVVHSGLCLRVGASEHVRTCATRVSIRELDEAELGWYLESGEWRERAGSYAIQGLGAALVTSIEGDYTNVVGLPVTALIDAVREVSPPVGC
jgi:septum formation protein